MGDSASNDLRRRYARPGEFEIPDAVLETSSFKQRLGGELNSDRKSPAAPSRELRPSSDLSPLRARPAPLAVETHLNGDPNQYRRSPAAVLREPRVSAELGLLGRNPVPLDREARLRLDLNRYRRNPAPQTSRDAIVRRRVSARFELLPEPKWRWNRIGWSAVAQLAFLGFLLLSPMIFPQEMQTALKFDVVELAQPITYINPPPPTPPPPPPPTPKVKPRVPPPPEPKPKVPKPKQVEVEPPELNPRQPHIFLVLKPEVRKVHTVEVKPVELKQVIQPMEIVLTSGAPKRPKEEVMIANLNPGPPAPATVAAPANKAQTGGFGDPQGTPGPGNPNKAGNINQAGSPNLPGGPGSGNGTGGAQGLRGTVPSDGSGMGAPAAGNASSGVAILYEPNPAYTNEARVLKMEGDVVLEVVFLASGQVQVTRVVSGLGHGLDEAAIQAAKQIRFKPAKRNGQAVDFPAHVRIEFRLTR